MMKTIDIFQDRHYASCLLSQLIETNVHRTSNTGRKIFNLIYNFTFTFLRLCILCSINSVYISFFCYPHPSVYTYLNIGFVKSERSIIIIYMLLCVVYNTLLTLHKHILTCAHHYIQKCVDEWVRAAEKANVYYKRIHDNSGVLSTILHYI